MFTFVTLLRKPQAAARTLQSFKAHCSTSEISEEIVIPKRVSRNSTDVLRTLESTIKKDPTAAHYKYHDDPFLIPTSNLAKRTYALSQESGRKAAHWVRQENRNLFLHREAEPMIESFIPKMVYDENSSALEEDLIKVIKAPFVSDAVLIYNLLKVKDIQISNDTKQSLLELLCYYNHTDPLPEEFIEERWFRQSNPNKERQRKTWKDGAMAEEIFKAFENPNAEAYCALIQGMIKHGQVDRAWQLFEEAQKKNLIISTDAYNAILSVTTFIKEGNDLRWNHVMNILTGMRLAQVKPNLGTLNAILKTLSMMGLSKTVKDNVLQIINEFKNLGIEPSLASWYYVLIAFCKERGPKNLILNDIINHLKGKEFKIRDLRDTFFFVTAMDVCFNHLHDNKLAKRINNLLLLGNNYDLIGDSYKESIYYRHYLSLMCETEVFDDFMEQIYHRIVPNIYIPEPRVMVEILKSLEVQGTVSYLPGLWSNIVVFDQMEHQNIINSVLNIMVDHNPPFNTSELSQKFANAAWDIWNKFVEMKENNIVKLTPTGDWLGKIMILLLRNKELNKASLVFDVLNKDQSIVGMPSFLSLVLFVENCVEFKLPNKAIYCIQYAVDNGFEEATSLAVHLNKLITLDEVQLGKLKGLLGTHSFQNKQVEIK